MTGTVLKCEGERALVATLPKITPCDMCHSPCHQKSCKKLKPIVLWAKNSAGAKPQENVELKETKTGVGLFSAFFCLMLPLIAAIVAFILTKGHVEEYHAFVISLAAFALTEIIFIPAAKRYEKKHPTLNIVKNLENL